MDFKRKGKWGLTAEEWDELIGSEENGAEMPEFDLEDSRDGPTSPRLSVEEHLAGLWRMLGLGD